MRAADEAALICDFAEYYGVFDIDSLPVRTQAILACGLRDGSRTMMRMGGNRLDFEQTLMAAMLDQLTFIAYSKTKDAQEGRNRPESVLKKLTGAEKTKNVQAFDSAEEFEKRLLKIRGEEDGIGH